MTYKDKPEFIAECAMNWVKDWDLKASGQMVEEDDEGEEHTVADEHFNSEDFIGELRSQGLPELKGLITELQQMLRKAA